MLANVRIWLDLVLQQMAADSYLTLPATSDQIQDALRLGNNNPNQGSSPTAPDLLGKTRMTDQQIAYFNTNFEIVDHRGNDDPRFAMAGLGNTVGNGSGFSATLFRNKITGEFTLSFRSTEFANEAQGGDWKRDGLSGAVGETSASGFAFGQLVAMEDYYAYLKSTGKLLASATLNATGYSLGGHLATVFTELHAGEVS